METEADSYAVLGISPGATLEEVRAAYRRAALKYHPDNCPEDPQGAYEQFCRITRAYQSVMRHLRGPKAQTPRWDAAMSPTGMALQDIGWILVSPEEAKRRTGDGPARKTRKTSLARVNEPRVFTVLWIVSLLLAVGAAIAVGAWFIAGRFVDDLSAGERAMMAAVSLGVYAVALAAGGFALVVTRRIVHMAMALRARRALPSPGKGRLEDSNSPGA